MKRELSGRGSKITEVAQCTCTGHEVNGTKN